MDHSPGLIGPNAILQLLPVVERIGGPERLAQMLAAAGIFEVPDGQSMIPETDAARLHHQLRVEEPEMASVLSGYAGIGTGQYILEHRIPAPAQLLLKALPRALSARFLSEAIAKHAWTFVGSGALHVASPWAFEIKDNPLIRGETSETCLCDWHASVFATLYQTLVTRRARCVEVSCGAQERSDRCRFEISC